MPVDYSLNCDPLVQILDLMGYLRGRKESTFSGNKMLNKIFLPEAPKLRSFKRLKTVKDSGGECKTAL